MKYSDFKRYKYSIITKNLNTLKSSFLKALRFEDIKIHLQNHFNLKRFNNQINTKKLYNYLNFRKLYNYMDFKKYNFLKVTRKIGLKKYKNLQIYLIVLPILISFLYLATPTFFKYEKLKIEQEICKNKNITCFIKGDVNYSFYPTPRIKIKDLTIYNSSKKKNIFIKVGDVSIKLSVKNLVIKKKQEFKKIIFNNFKINIDLKNLKKYKNIFKEKNNFIPLKFSKGEILLLDKDNYVATIHEAKLNFILDQDSKNIKIKGKLFDDDLYINLKNMIIDDKMSTRIILKMSDLNLLTKVKLFNFDKEEDKIQGDIFIKKDKNKFTGIFNYQNGEIKISKSNLRNIFLDGKLNGTIKLLPFFDINLDLNLNSVNFTKLYSYFLALDEKSQKSFFKINKKINGKINLSSDRIYSSYNLVKSFESRITFNNGNISIEQFLINLGKLGAADISGTVNNNKKFSNFKYESNIFIDNQKKFLSKFGIYKQKKIPTNLFISGNFDLKRGKAIFYEISNNEKLALEDINFIEQEFNNYMLEDGYKYLFLFPKFKEFIKSVTAKDN